MKSYKEIVERLLDTKRHTIIGNYGKEIYEKIESGLRKYPYGRSFKIDTSYIEDLELRADAISNAICKHKTNVIQNDNEMLYLVVGANFDEYMLEDKTPEDEFYDKENDCIVITHPVTDVSFRVLRDKVTLMVCHPKRREIKRSGGGRNSIDPYDRGGLLMNR